MKVSVIIPSFNHDKFVERAVQSVLNQTYENIELIVIDDGSKDNSVQILRGLNKENIFNLIIKENEGVCATLNKGIELSQGELLVFLASDDIMPPNRIFEQVKWMEENPETSVLSGWANIIDEHDKNIGTKKPRIGEAKFFDIAKRNFILAPTAMIRKNIFKKYGYYETRYKLEDYYLWLKLLSNDERIVVAPRVWADYRILDSNVAKRAHSYYFGQVEILNQYKDHPNYQEIVKSVNSLYFLKNAFLGEDLVSRKECPIKLYAKFAGFFIKLIPSGIRMKIYQVLVSRA